MTRREPFGLGALITDYLWFLARRAHLVLGQLGLQVIVSFVLLTVLGLFEIEDRNVLRARAVTIVVLIPLLMISTYVISVSRWRKRAEIGWRSLIQFRMKSILLRTLFAICAIALTVISIYGTEYSLRALPKNQGILLAVVVGFALLPMALGPLYLNDLFPNPWAGLWPYIKGIHRFAAGLIVFTALCLLIVSLLRTLWDFLIGPYFLTRILSVYTPKQEHFQLLQNTSNFLFIQTLLFLQLIAAAFLFERYKEITYGRDLSHVADAF